MADASYIKSLFGGLDPAIKKAADAAFTYVLGNLTIGPYKDGTIDRRAKNFQWYWMSATTPAVAGTEFSIAHNLGRVPAVIIPVLPLDQVGGRLINLQVSRAADVNRIYLKSESTSAAITVLVE